ncbi:MAG: enoyl-CoA hydratase [Hyphomicrobiaceae bacterium]|nr:enoyl-CoA hydratase [Hyphomicrobiaceae bacterium]
MNKELDHAGGGDAPAVITRPESGIAVITLNRPHQRNALSLGMMSALQVAIEVLSGDADVCAIVIAANGPAFSAGHDLKELTAHRSDQDGGHDFFHLTMDRCAKLMQSIVKCAKPVIAAVEGTATAAGCQLVATCDLAVGADSAKFCTPGVNIGLFCSTPMVALSRNVGRKRAMEMLLLGELIDAKTAADWGLLNRAVPKDKVMDEALGFARRIVAKSPATVAIGKEAFYHQAEQGLEKAYDYAVSVMVRNMLYRDAEEGISAFLEKRNPKWQGC